MFIDTLSRYLFGLNFQYFSIRNIFNGFSMRFFTLFFEPLTCKYQLLAGAYLRLTALDFGSLKQSEPSPNMAVRSCDNLHLQHDN